MALSSISLIQTFPSKPSNSIFPIKFQPSKILPFIPSQICFTNCPPELFNHRRLQKICCAAAKQQQQKQKSNKKRRKKSTGSSEVPKEFSLKDVEMEAEIESEMEGEGDSGKITRQQGFVPLPLPKPPAGFVVDEQGRVLMVSSKRIATIVDPTNNLPLECVIRRAFRSSQGDECMLLYPVDMPVMVLKSTNVDGWSAVTDEEVESILPTAAYALAKIHLHLVHSGFCYTARGGFCYSEGSIFEFQSGDGQDIDGVPTEAVDITYFHLDGAHYMIYTPTEPLLFVAVKDQNGHLRIAEDDLLDDPAIISAIDEETEFNALVEEEAALMESVLGER